VVASIRAMLEGARLPDPTPETRRCRECSLKDICQPEATRALQADPARCRALFDTDVL
jgi:CRISPR-associated exonuclease Cas4